MKFYEYLRLSESLARSQEDGDCEDSWKPFDAANGVICEPKADLPENWEFESENWALILPEVFSWKTLRQVCLLVLGSVAFIAVYYPLMRGICWLILAVGWWFGVDGAVWPGDYTPYPEQF